MRAALLLLFIGCASTPSAVVCRCECQAPAPYVWPNIQSVPAPFFVPGNIPADGGLWLLQSHIGAITLTDGSGS